MKYYLIGGCIPIILITIFFCYRYIQNEKNNKNQAQSNQDIYNAMMNKKLGTNGVNYPIGGTLTEEQQTILLNIPKNQPVKPKQ